MNNRRHFLFGSSIIFLLFACVLLWSPGQANAAYKISYDSTSLTADSLTITVAWNSTGSYDWDNGARPYFSVNGVIKQYDWSPGTASPLNYFSANLQVGTNTFSMWSNAGDQDDCGCGGNASPDAVYAKVTFANGQSLYTGSSPWSPGGGTLLTLPAVCSPSYPSYIQNNPCGNCCYTQVSKTISVVLSPTATI
jgi:hypothetical protein